MSIKVEPYGTTKDGKEIKLYTITNRNNTVLKLTDMGAIWVSMIVADKDGNMDDVVLGLDSGDHYETESYDAFGATVGRNANRICKHRFVLNGIEYNLADNDSGHNLHSGPDSYYTRLWKGEIIDDEEGQGVEFSLFSPDGDQGMPGNLNISVSYVLTEDDSVVIEYNGVSDADTIVNMTNHSYFNLGGHKSGSIEDELVWIDAEGFTFGADGVVTTGEIRDVSGTPLDFRQLKRIGDEIDAEYEPLNRCGGYDHNFCLKTNGESVELVAKVVCEKTGRVMDIFTDLPGLQMYTGNFINEKNPGKDGAVYHPRCGVAFETQFYPDAINQPQFPSPVVKAGEQFNYCTVYHFSVME
ncbi:MAG: aldose epimerase family protein [Butyrivibrio sp.]